MFGYVRPYKPEMKMAEYEKYRAVYCGLCREIGQVSGQLSRLALSYDIVLLASVRMILEGISPVFTPYRCPVQPAEKRLVLLPNRAVTYTAAVFAALAAAKNADDLHDERGVHRIRPLLLAPMAKHLEKAADRVLPAGTTGEIGKRLAFLSEKEGARCSSVDVMAQAFGDVLGYLFSLGLEGEDAETASVFGQSVGAFLYLCDAADDLPDDFRKHRYNPLLLSWGEMATDGGKLSPMVKDSLRTALPVTLEGLEKAAEKLDSAHPLTPIVKNIIFLGLPYSLGRVLDGREKDKPCQNKV